MISPHSGRNRFFIAWAVGGLGYFHIPQLWDEDKISILSPFKWTTQDVLWENKTTNISTIEWSPLHLTHACTFLCHTWPFHIPNCSPFKTYKKEDYKKEDCNHFLKGLATSSTHQANEPPRAGLPLCWINCPMGKVESFSLTFGSIDSKMSLTQESNCKSQDSTGNR